jgi:inner membrane protein
VPTIISHPAVPLALGLALGSRLIPGRLLVAGVIASVVPDLDVIAFRLGLNYAHAAGHRGLTHSMAFALALGALTTIFSSALRASPRTVLLFVAVSALSHPLLDMLTNGGLGAALLWPFSESRLFFPFRPIEVSPLSLRRFLGEPGLRVLLSEVVWIWLPCLVLGFGARVAWRKNAL